ncbi:MAG TPA: hypothetical protein EYG71_07335 [Leucothrix sp.]|nr:hypothetical protein [Leucothrix sp.]
MSKAVLKVKDCSLNELQDLLGKYQLSIILVEPDKTIPGSYWGDTEAGIIRSSLYVSPDTPIHSLLHESCHYICMDKLRRESLNTDAEGDYDEENAVCYLQILLADEIPDMGKSRMMQDMNNWGYTFRLGSAENWFNNDAEDALARLQKNKIVNKKQRVTFNLHQ